MKHTSLNVCHPKYGSINLAASLGLLLLLGGCLSMYGQSDSVVSGMERASYERPSLSSLFASILDSIKSYQMESMTMDSNDSSSFKSSPSMVGAKELPNKNSSAENVDPPTAKGSSLSLIELEAKKAQAMVNQCLGVECVDCVDDGKGNMLPPPSLIPSSLKRQKLT